MVGVAEGRGVAPLPTTGALTIGLSPGGLLGLVLSSCPPLAPTHIFERL